MRRVNKGERARLRLTLNGRKMSGEAEPRMLLSDFLRHVLGATGTHVGCEHGVCGCCTVLLDGTAVRSCLTLAVQAEGRAVTTVESLAGADGKLSVLQLNIIEDATGQTLDYAWADPSTSIIGINLGWLQVGLTIENATR